MNYKHFTIEERCCLREYSDKDPGQKGRNDGESDHSGTVGISERSGENHHMRQGERVCMLEGDRESTKL